MLCQGDKLIVEKMLPERILTICKECHAYYKAKIDCISTIPFFFFSFMCKGGILIRKYVAH